MRNVTWHTLFCKPNTITRACFALNNTMLNAQCTQCSCSLTDSYQKASKPMHVSPGPHGGGKLHGSTAVVCSAALAQSKSPQYCMAVGFAEIEYGTGSALASCRCLTVCLICIALAATTNNWPLLEQRLPSDASRRPWALAGIQPL